MHHRVRPIIMMILLYHPTGIQQAVVCCIMASMIYQANQSAVVRLPVYDSTTVCTSRSTTPYPAEGVSVREIFVRYLLSTLRYIYLTYLLHLMGRQHTNYMTHDTLGERTDFVRATRHAHRHSRRTTYLRGRLRTRDTGHFILQQSTQQQCTGRQCSFT